MAGTAFGGQINNQFLHDGQIGAITLVTAFLFDAEQVGMGQCFEMKGQIGGW